MQYPFSLPGLATRRTVSPPSLSSLLEGSGWPVLRACLDAVAVGGALLLSLPALGAAGLGGAEAALLVFFAPLALGGLALQGAYDRTALPLVADLRRTITAVAIATFSILVLQTIFIPEASLAAACVRISLFAVAGVSVAHGSLHLARRTARRRGRTGNRTLIIGAGEVGADVERRLLASPEQGLVPVGFVDTDPVPGLERCGPVLGGPADIARIVHRSGAQHAVIAFSQAPDSELYGTVRLCQDLGLDITVVPRLYESTNLRTEQRRVAGMPLFELHTPKTSGVGFALKHGLDRLIAALAMVCLAPVLIALALGVKLSSPGPVLFRQKRVGRDGRIFDMLKFRSMATVRPQQAGDRPVLAAAGSAPGGVEGIDRRTTLGRFLRRTSLDELPQLWNIVRGDMSLVGPRPERPDWVERFGDQMRRYDDRHRVRAGLTGWAQVNGLRGQTSIADRVEHDNFYIENWSPWLDLKCLARTATALKGE